VPQEGRMGVSLLVAILSYPTVNHRLHVILDLALN
jgi:hypothetical protein